MSRHDARRSKNPVFFYSQPKNVHNVVLAMQETPKVTRSYGTRQVKISAAIERLDGCFGDFIAALRSRHIYDDSLIVVTSDHGSEEEAGFEGHGLYLRPDDLRVPLIIHLPKSLRHQFVTDPSQVAFVSDITPTITELLGAKIEAPPQFTGRPLFTRTLTEQATAARPYYLIESSYFPVFGILSENGTKLYVDNAQTRSRVFYDLSSDPAAHHNLLNEEIERREQARIRQELDAFNHWYQRRPQTVSFAEWWLR
jgi:arylsulfatase A-like enzyme